MTLISYLPGLPYSAPVAHLDATDRPKASGFSFIFWFIFSIALFIAMIGCCIRIKEAHKENLAKKEDQRKMIHAQRMRAAQQRAIQQSQVAATATTVIGAPAPAHARTVDSSRQYGSAYPQQRTHQQQQTTAVPIVVVRASPHSGAAVGVAGAPAPRVAVSSMAGGYGGGFVPQQPRVPSMDIPYTYNVPGYGGQVIAGAGVEVGVGAGASGSTDVKSGTAR